MILILSMELPKMHTKPMRKIFELEESLKGGVEAIEKNAKGAVNEFKILLTPISDLQVTITFYFLKCFYFLFSRKIIFLDQSLAR